MYSSLKTVLEFSLVRLRVMRNIRGRSLHGENEYRIRITTLRRGTADAIQQNLEKLPSSTPH
jgi:hypothetical protein